MPGGSGRSRLGYPQHTTLTAQAPSGFVTITHPHHPLRDQRVQIVRIRRRAGAEPDLVVRRPDGAHAAIAMSWTDYAALPALATDAQLLPLLDLDGLWRAVDLVAHLRHNGDAR